MGRSSGFREHSDVQAATGGAREALKWLVEDMSGALADPVKTTRANNALRKQVHQELVALGWAERVSQMSFRLLRDPGAREQDPLLPGDDIAEADEIVEEGEAVEAVQVLDVTGDDGLLVLAGLAWSPWRPLEAAAAHEATTQPGVYVARSEGEVVYVGMAGDRRGKGVRGRASVYARGRGAVSGLGEAALDRALDDPAWLADRLAKILNTDVTYRTKDWAKEALRRANIEVCSGGSSYADTALAWEARVLLMLEDEVLWNRARPGP